MAITVSNIEYINFQDKNIFHLQIHLLFMISQIHLNEKERMTEKYAFLEIMPEV